MFFAIRRRHYRRFAMCLLLPRLLMLAASCPYALLIFYLIFTPAARYYAADDVCRCRYFHADADAAVMAALRRHGYALLRCRYAIPRCLICYRAYAMPR